MKSLLVVSTIGFILTSQASLAQVGQSSADNPSQPVLQTQPSPGIGVNVYQTLNPIPPTSRATQPTSQTVATTGALEPFAPRGANVGAVTLFPSVTGATYYDDNVFALSRNRLSDWAYVIRPELALRSNNWSNVDLGANAYVEGRKYDKYNSEDQVNAGGSIGGTAAIGSDTQLVGRAQYFHAHEDRGVSDTITNQFNKPLAYDQGEAALALNNRFGRFWTSVGAAGLVVRYEDASVTVPGTPSSFQISQSYRNGDVERLPVRVGYVVAPLTSIFVEAAGNRRDFDVNAFDSQGYRVVGGLLLEPGPGSRVRGEVFAGYMDQNYSGASFQHVKTWTAGASMAFLLTNNLTLGVEGRRDAREASLSGGLVTNDGVSVIESVATIRTDYRIMPNVVIGGGLSYIQDEFLNAGRTDQAWSPLASIKYFVNPILTLGLDYRRVNFDSSAFGVPSYFRDVYLLSANARF